MRLFLGCPLDADTARKVAAWAEEELKGLPVKLVPAENLHATTLFFGEVDEETAALLSHATGLVGWQPMRAEAKALKLYGKTALSLALDAPIDPLQVELRGDAETPLSRMASLLHAMRPRENRPLDLHVTIARARGAIDSRRLPPPPRIHASLDSLVLYRSHLSQRGAHYERLAESQVQDPSFRTS